MAFFKNKKTLLMCWSLILLPGLKTYTFQKVDPQAPVSFHLLRSDGEVFRRLASKGEATLLMQRNQNRGNSSKEAIRITGNGNYTNLSTHREMRDYNSTSNLWRDRIPSISSSENSSILNSPAETMKKQYSPTEKRTMGKTNFKIRLSSVFPASRMTRVFRTTNREKTTSQTQSETVTAPATQPYTDVPYPACGNCALTHSLPPSAIAGIILVCLVVPTIIILILFISCHYKEGQQNRYEGEGDPMIPERSLYI